MQGAVVLEVRIGRDGAVQDVKLVGGQRLLANASIAAVKQWRFRPRMRQGQPVEMQTKVTLNFRLPTTGEQRPAVKNEELQGCRSNILHGVGVGLGGVRTPIP